MENYNEAQMERQELLKVLTKVMQEALFSKPPTIGEPLRKSIETQVSDWELAMNTIDLVSWDVYNSLIKDT